MKCNKSSHAADALGYVVGKISMHVVHGLCTLHTHRLSTVCMLVVHVHHSQHGVLHATLKVKPNLHRGTDALATGVCWIAAAGLIAIHNARVGSVTQQ
jgi:hypothetical protein